MDGAAPTRKRVRLVDAGSSRDLAMQLGHALEAAGFALIEAGGLERALNETNAKVEEVLILLKR